MGEGQIIKEIRELLDGVKPQIANIEKKLAELEKIKQETAEETPSPAPINLLTYAEYAEMMGVTKCTVFNWVKKGAINAIEVAPRFKRIPASELYKTNKRNKVSME